MQIAKCNAMLTGTAAGFKEAFSAGGKAVGEFVKDTQKEFNKYRAAAEKLNSDVLSPMEKLRARLLEVRALGAKGWIDPEATRKATAQILQQSAKLREETQKTTASVQTLEKAVVSTSNKASQGATGTLSFLQRMKKATGEDSGFGLAVKTLAGAGAVAAIGMAANKFAQMTGAIASASTAYREGRISSSEFTSEIVKSIPIIGQVITGIENIGEAITGARAIADAAKARDAGARGAIEGTPDSFSAKDFVDAATKRAGSLEQDLSTRFMTEFEKAGVNAARKYNEAIWESVSDSQKAIDSLRNKAAEDIAKLLGVENDAHAAETLRAEAYTKRIALEQSLIDEEAKIRKAALREQSAYRAAKEQAIIDAQAELDEKQLMGMLGSVLEKVMKPIIEFKADAPRQIGSLNGIGGFLKKGFAAALNPMDGNSLTVAEAPQLLQAGSQAAASFVARAQREQAAKANDPATVAAKTTADNTKRQNELTEQVLSKLSTPVELI